MHDEFSNGSVEERLQQERLARLAEILGCAPEDFHTGGGNLGDVGAMAELLRLWLAMPTAEDRAQVLALARRLAGG